MVLLTRGNRSGMADQEARIRRIQRRLPSSPPHAGPAGTIERSRSASSRHRNAAASLRRKFISAGAHGARGSTGSRSDQAAASSRHLRDAGTQAEHGRVPSWRGFVRSLPDVPACQHCRRRSRAAGAEPWPAYTVRAFLARGSSLAPNICAVGCSSPLQSVGRSAAHVHALERV